MRNRLFSVTTFLKTALETEGIFNNANKQMPMAKIIERIVNRRCKKGPFSLKINGMEVR
jgi:hypothetical protein